MFTGIIVKGKNDISLHFDRGDDYNDAWLFNGHGEMLHLTVDELIERILLGELILSRCKEEAI